MKTYQPTRPTPKAMWLFRQYRALHHNLDKVLATDSHWKWWNEMDNKNRTYVLTGRWS